MQLTTNLPLGACRLLVNATPFNREDTFFFFPFTLCIFIESPVCDKSPKLCGLHQSMGLVPLQEKKNDPWQIGACSSRIQKRLEEKLKCRHQCPLNICAAFVVSWCHRASVQIQTLRRVLDSEQELLAGCGLQQTVKASTQLKNKNNSKQKISLVPRWKWEHSAAGFFSQSLKSGVLRKV